ncbi:HNH endonuclease [Nocardia farcinica]|uniref:HNH endonuclease n=1 Tax=Nocardia farcinica TaxID=37329 RepID=UPI001895C150|nr:HNH endonuclease signature motif containing protein [Nocardia farcinica]MBF6584421.1 HNH endonuclease [Nocardia farcinica]
MPGSPHQRNTTTRDRHRAVLRRNKPPCGICGQDIDYTLPHLHPHSYVVDHIIPLARGGTDDLDNKQPAHRHCNETKAARTTEELTAAAGPRTYITHRTW